MKLLITKNLLFFGMVLQLYFETHAQEMYSPINMLIMRVFEIDKDCFSVWIIRRACSPVRLFSDQCSVKVNENNVSVSLFRECFWAITALLHMRSSSIFSGKLGCVKCTSLARSPVWVMLKLPGDCAQQVRTRCRGIILNA